jgi:hypothetical protein
VGASLHKCYWLNHSPLVVNPPATLSSPLVRGFSWGLQYSIMPWSFCHHLPCSSPSSSHLIGLKRTLMNPEITRVLETLGQKLWPKTILNTVCISYCVTVSHTSLWTGESTGAKVTARRNKTQRLQNACSLALHNSHCGTCSLMDSLSGPAGLR